MRNRKEEVYKKYTKGKKLTGESKVGKFEVHVYGELDL